MQCVFPRNLETCLDEQDLCAADYCELVRSVSVNKYKALKYFERLYKALRTIGRNDLYEEAAKRTVTAIKRTTVSVDSNTINIANYVLAFFDVPKDKLI